MYKVLSGNDTIRTKIEHPISPGKFLYLLFDATHNIKNAYNNWINKGRFVYPAGFPEFLDDFGTADFNHIRSLYRKEESLPLKAAHKLTMECLNPASIARTSPRHALAVFHESTPHALQFYDEPGWSVTSQFVTFMSNLWKILNVKNPSKGEYSNLLESDNYIPVQVYMYISFVQIMSKL